MKRCQVQPLLANWRIAELAFTKMLTLYEGISDTNLLLKRCEFLCLFPHAISEVFEIFLYGNILWSQNPESLQSRDSGLIQSRDPRVAIPGLSVLTERFRLPTLPPRCDQVHESNEGQSPPPHTHTHRRARSAKYPIVASSSAWFEAARRVSGLAR